jgi:hypothetical protein
VVRAVARPPRQRQPRRTLTLWRGAAPAPTKIAESRAPADAFANPPRAYAQPGPALRGCGRFGRCVDASSRLLVSRPSARPLALRLADDIRSRPTGLDKCGRHRGQGGWAPISGTTVLEDVAVALTVIPFWRLRAPECLRRLRTGDPRRVRRGGGSACHAPRRRTRQPAESSVCPPGLRQPVARGGRARPGPRERRVRPPRDQEAKPAGEIAVEIASELFTLGGTSATSDALNLHRHWRDARTNTLHDPTRWKYHTLGEHPFTGVLPGRHPLAGWSSRSTVPSSYCSVWPMGAVTSQSAH